MNTSKSAPKAKCIKTKNGFMVNFYGLCFYVDTAFNYRPSKETVSDGLLPTTNWYGKLRSKSDCIERKLNEQEQAQCELIAGMLEKDPLHKLNDGQRAAAQKKIDVRNFNKARATTIGNHPSFKKKFGEKNKIA